MRQLAGADGGSVNGATTPFWTKIAPTRGRAAAVSFVFACAVLRFVGVVISAIHLNHGDFFATLPGAYAEHWNLTLWDSPDLRESVAFHRHSYGYGPTQYVTLWPIVFLDSYRTIAAVLLPVYIVVFLAAPYALWRVGDAVVPDIKGSRWGRVMSVYASVLLFGPLLMALAQREFEVVQALMIVLAGYAVVRGRPAAGGAILGYVSMFKYWVLGLLGYFVLRRQWKAVMGFAIGAAAVLLLAHAVFDLGRFPFASATAFDRQFGRIYKPLERRGAFCAEETGTAASVQSGVCAIVGGRSRAAEPMFYAILGAVGAAFLALFIRFERSGPMVDSFDERWRRLIEFCFFLIGAGIVFHAHYYYLSILILPLTMVLYRNVWRPGGGANIRVGLGLLAYAALSAFVAPTAVLSRVTGVDVWSFYLSHGVYVYGYVALVALLFWEYSMLLAREVSS